MFLPLELPLRPSRIYLALMALAHALALAGIWLAALPLLLQALLSAALLAGAWWLWREYHHEPEAVRISQSGRLEVLVGEWRAAELAGRPVVLPWLVSMELVPAQGKPRRLLLWPDSTDRDGFRKLRVWLRWSS